MFDLTLDKSIYLPTQICIRYNNNRGTILRIQFYET